MRAYLLPTIIALIPASIPTPASGQDAGKIVDQYIKAEGGSKTLSKVNTLTLEGTFANAASEKVGTYTLINKQPNRYYSELVVNVINRYSDYKRFNAESISTLGKPKVGADGPASAPTEPPHSSDRNNLCGNFSNFQLLA
jgi:hypothetical protein